VREEFLLLYGDNFWPLELDKLEQFYREKGARALVTIYANLDNYSRNNIEVSNSGFVEKYDKQRKTTDLNGVEIGYFILNKKILLDVFKKNCSFEETVLPYLIKKKQLAGYLTYNKYYGLSNLSRIQAIKEFFKQKKVVFLDRDGVINKKAPKAMYVTSWRTFEFLPHVKEALQLLMKKNYLIYIITNQPGIARKMMTRKQLDQIHANLKILLKKIGVVIEGIYICQHGWNDGCLCRKPKSGLFFQAAAEHNINLSQSYCIGDDERDIIAGKAAGCRTIHITPNLSLYSAVKKFL
jgi:D-glycero-D-manno-heptose 1,7-bisphosphate phosphatase